ncbi:hypothetical protein AVEN_139695-1, partial [Araneus ventricosus]
SNRLILDGPYSYGSLSGRVDGTKVEAAGHPPIRKSKLKATLLCSLWCKLVELCPTLKRRPTEPSFLSSYEFYDVLDTEGHLPYCSFYSLIEN